MSTLSFLRLLPIVVPVAVGCSNAAAVSVDARVLVPDSSNTIDAPAVVETGTAYHGGTYTNTFDGLPTTAVSSDMVSQVVTGVGPFAFSVLTGAMATNGMDGWEFANPMGSGMDTEFRVHDGSLSGSTGRGVVSFGTDGASERALGFLPTGNQIDRIGLLLRNATSGTLTQMTIGYTGEQWRRGDVAAPDSLTFEYGVAASLDDAGLTTETDLAFNAPITGMPTSVALDGNAAANRQAVSKTITGISWAPGTMMVLRWTAGSQSGKDDGLAVDDFSFAAQ